MKKEKNDFLQLGLDNNNYGNYSFFFSLFAFEYVRNQSSNIFL